MKKIFCLLLFLLPICGFSQSVLGKFKQKLKDRVEQRTDQGMDKAIDKTEETIKEERKKPKEEKKVTEEAENKDNTQTTTASVPNNPEGFESYSRYDFVPGAQIMFAEDFGQDVIGEFPLLWKTNNRGEVVTVRSLPGQWLRLFHKGRFLSPAIKNLPDNFTVEFDMIMSFQQLNYVYPDIKIQLLQLGAGEAPAKEYIINNNANTYVETTLMSGDEESSTIALQSFKNNNEDFKSDPKGLKKLGSSFGKTFHVAMWIQKERLRLWINGEKINDVPQAVPVSSVFDRLAFDIGDAFYEDEQIGLYISNIRIAAGAADLRNKSADQFLKSH
jgi:OOP family OmpA-OmpF porin